MAARLARTKSDALRSHYSLVIETYHDDTFTARGVRLDQTTRKVLVDLILHKEPYSPEATGHVGLVGIALEELAAREDPQLRLW